MREKGEMNIALLSLVGRLKTLTFYFFEIGSSLMIYLKCVSSK